MEPQVSLRRVVEADLPIFFDHHSDPIAIAIAVFPPRDHDAFFTHWRSILQNCSNSTCTVLVDGEVAGHVVAFDRSGHREVGYWIGRDFWGRGVASRAVSLLLEREPGRPLRAWVATSNPASRRVLEKNGFVLDREVPAEPGSGEPNEWLLILAT